MYEEFLDENELKVPLSFTSNNYIQKDGIISAVGINASGRAWLLKVDEEGNKFTTNWLL